MESRLDVGYSFAKIYVDEILHLAFRHEKLQCIQSWVDTGKWCIEIYLKGEDPILMEYDEVEKWKQMLKLLDKV